MKRRFATIATLVSAGSVRAASGSQSPHVRAAGNPDLSSGLDRVCAHSETLPGSQDSLLYNGFEQGKSELSPGSAKVNTG